MKPFSKFKAISGEPVVTLDGRKVTQLKEFALQGPFQIVGVLDDYKSVQTWTDDGKFFSHGVSVHDLFMASVVKEGWVAFGPDKRQEPCHGVGFGTHVWGTEAEAKHMYLVANKTAPAGTVKVTWEE